MTTDKKDIKEWLCESIDKDYYDQRYSMAQKAFAPSEPCGKVGSGGKMPDYADLKAEYKEVGISNRILQAQITTMSRILRAVPEPEFPDLDEYTGQVRQGFWKARTKPYGLHTTDGFKQIQNAWLDGDGLGMGFVQFGLKTNPENGFRKTIMRHVPVFQMIWDRHARNFSDARMGCAMIYMPLDKAIVRFGKETAMKHVHTMYESGTDSELRVVRVFEYFDLGHGKSEPTSAVILGDVENDAIEVDPNPYGCLPFAHYEHLLQPGWRRAIGRIDLLVADQESLNEGERRIRAEMRRSGFDIVPPDYLNSDQIARVASGEAGVVVPSERPLEQGETGYERVPGGEVSATTLKAMEMREQNFIANSGVSELDMGQDVDGADTLGEVQLVDQRGKTQSNWSVFQTAMFFQRCVNVFEKVAMVGDDEPVMLNVLGSNVLFNDPENPALMINQWLQEPSDVTVSEEALLKGDAERERMAKTQRLMSIGDLVQGGMVDPNWWAEERMKALGYDPKKALTMYLQEAQMMNPMQQEQAMQGQPAA